METSLPLIYVPLSQELIGHVKRLDGFNDEEISKLKDLLFGLAAAEIHSPDDHSLVLTLKLNQVFALLELDLAAGESPAETLATISAQLKQHGGLDYVPRARTPQGRAFEHASDSKVLFKLLQKSPPANKAVKLEKAYYIKLERPGVESAKDAEKEERTLFSLNPELIDVAIKANGKAELYFHAYFWNTFSQHLHAKAHPDNKDSTLFEKEVIATSNEHKRLKGLGEFLAKVHANLAKNVFTKDIYDNYVAEFGGRKVPRHNKKLLEDVQRQLLFALICDDKDSLHWIEKLLIQLLGYYDLSVRDQAIIFLNILYDGMDWQLTQAFRPVVRVVGQHFKVNIIVDFDPLKNQDSQIFIGLSAPSPIEGVNQTILTWHKIDERNIVGTKGFETEISINFGKFWKCGFYDWRLVVVKDNGRLTPLEMIGRADNPLFNQLKQQAYSEYYQEDDFGTGASQQAQGRFIVHAKGMRDHIFHEVYVDHEGADIDAKEGKFIKRGDFAKVEKAIGGYKKKGITALYLMGALERDNNPHVNRTFNSVEYRKPDAAPLAITCRESANKMLGGDEGFQKVMKQAQTSKVKIIIDCLARIASSRNHRKYSDLMLSYLDEDGKKLICYGTDGQSINYEDTAMLNYRKLEAWELLINEVLSFSKKHGINGVHLDNGQAWPQIMEADLEELQRLDCDGQPAYSPEEVLNGEIVLRNENCGYWNSGAIDTYANPFFIKMCRKLWNQLPDFMIIGECWGGLGFENRHILLSRSGIIPRVFKLPQAICSVFGKRLCKDGRIIACERDIVKTINDWYEKGKRQFMPEGSILIQSSTAHQWPYPAYLYGKGTWAAVDILHFMPDIPITFMGEIDGEVYRPKTTNIFQHEMQEEKPAPTQAGSTTLKRTNSQLKMLMNQAPAKEEASTQQAVVDGEAPIKGLVRVRSGSNLAALVVENRDGDLKQKEFQFKAQIGPAQGFDLSQINTHYEHRRRLRREKMVLRYGEFIPLVARTEVGYEDRVLSFSRYSLQETAIIATNLNDNETQFYVDLSPLKQLYLSTYKENTVVMVTDWLKTDVPMQYFFLKELLTLKSFIRLAPFKSSVLGLSICSTEDSFVVKKALLQSIERTKVKLSTGQSIESEQISLIFTEILEKAPSDVVRFANVIGSLQEAFLDKLSSSSTDKRALTFYDLFLHNHKLKADPILSSRLVALSQRILEISEGKELAPKKAAQSIVESNNLGPIVFCTPELGRWSTMGGLGVMVDELAYGLALLGQEVWVISPYYEKNRKGETGYLAKDPAGIEYKENIEVTLNAKYTLGVHEGQVQGVKVIFLHNSEIFPVPYPDLSCAEVVRQLAVFGKACLEFCCARFLIPSVCITNDWFTALIPAYAKQGVFGPTFSGTTFLHIAHNLELSYEGRLFPQPRDGALEHIHQLPRDWLVNPAWGPPTVINPSRCAIMLSDQWATVSPSYKHDLLNTSPLADLLRQKPQPFAFPNGIPVEARIKKLNECAPDHPSAKRLIQKKYFGYQELDDAVPLLAFVGRITTQKGVHLILDAAETLITKYNYRINILVGGMANNAEAYSAQCAHKMRHLKDKYPNCFWADPNQFFTDGSLVNRGTDFGLMPSIFEPGGIVQHEFFIGGTPVIAFKTGGLKDSVFEYNWDSETGNGYTFESHYVNDFIFACERALGTYKNKAKYLKLRQNAFDSTMDGERVSRAWLAEFFRLRGKVFVDQKIMRETLLKMSTWSPSAYKPIYSFEELFGIEKGTLTNFTLDDLDFGAEEEKTPLEEGAGKVVSAFENPKEVPRQPHVFTMHNNGPRYAKVELCGSFDEWKVRHPMSFDTYTNQWFITLHLTRGQYFYKYIVNGSQWTVNDKETKEKDPLGNINNALNL